MPRAWVNPYRALKQRRLSSFGSVDGLSVAAAPGPRQAYAVPMFVGLVVTLWLR